MAKKKSVPSSGVEAIVPSLPPPEYAGPAGEHAKRTGAVPRPQHVTAKTDKTQQRAYRRNRPPSGG